MQAARQIEASGGLRDRLSTLLGSDRPAPIGSADWEARIEITKIEGEQRQVRTALGFRFILNQGLKNLFPQDANYNTSAYKTLENEMADWVAMGADVHFEIQLSGYDANGRPQTVMVAYEVSHPNWTKPIPMSETHFTNNSSQEYVRMDRAEIQKMTRN